MVPADNDKSSKSSSSKGSGGSLDMGKMFSMINNQVTKDYKAIGMPTALECSLMLKSVASSLEIVGMPCYGYFSIEESNLP